jgi:hypothetical protein
MADDEIEFSITWEGAVDARLYLLIDNSKLVATEVDRVHGTGALRHRYRAPAATFHILEWSLRFEGLTVRALVAKAAVNGAAPTTLDAHLGDKQHQWTSRGAAP